MSLNAETILIELTETENSYSKLLSNIKNIEQLIDDACDL